MRLPFSRNQKKKRSNDQFVPLSASQEPSGFGDSLSSAQPAPTTPPLPAPSIADAAAAPPRSTTPESFRRINLSESVRPVSSLPALNGGGHQRGLSASSLSSARFSSVGRPVSKVFSQPRSPSAILQLAQLEEELDTIMDEMGLEGEQRMQMKNLPLDNKIQLIHSHKANEIKAQKAHITPLSEHLKILSRAGTQSLPKSRVEKLRVDLSYQSIQQINAFIEEGGLRLLLAHLSQLSDRKTSKRRDDEVQKEYELLRCILAVIKVSLGAEYMLSNTSHLRHVLGSIDSLWLPCSVMVLRIFSYLVQQKNLDCAESLLASLFRKESSAEGGSKRRNAFILWMEAVENAISDYTTTAALTDPQTEANIVEFISHSLLFINNLVAAIPSSLTMRIRFYEKLNDHGMLVKLSGLRTWCVPSIDSHLNRWDEALRRDYNIARSQRPGDIILENGNDSTIVDMGLMTGFIAHYAAAKQADSHDRTYPSDNEDEFLTLNVGTYSRPQSVHCGNASGRQTPNSQMKDAGSPQIGTARNLPSAGMERPLSRSNPFYSANNSPSLGSGFAMPASSTSTNVQPNADDSRSVTGFPFTMHSNRSQSNVAETGSLRDLRRVSYNGSSAAGAAGAAGGNGFGSSVKSPTSQPADSSSPGTAAPSSSLTGLKNAHALLKKSYLGIIAHKSKDGSALHGDEDGELYNELLAISELAQTMLDAIDGKGPNQISFYG